MKKIIIPVLITISSLVFGGCKESPESIHINLPSRTDWKVGENSIEKGFFKQTKSILLTWSAPKNDTPPEYVQISSSWGAININLEPDQTQLLIEKSMFEPDPKISNTPFIFWFSPTFANKVEIDGASLSASEIYFVGAFQMKNN